MPDLQPLRKVSKNFLKPKPLSLIALIVTIFAGLIVYAKTSRGGKNPYSLAEDLPRGALVYAQFSDLPALIKKWDQSSLKQQYLSSTNYSQFQHRHLALKLVQRWEEFNNALGFPIDTASISEATDAGAAIAIYDIGRLDLVFVAPLSAEKLAATKFFKNKEQFEETELPDGATYYRHEVEADRGRQKQQLVFATVKGRFILATNERLLLRAIANVKGKKQKDSLWDDVSFETLSRLLTPHFVTVWVDQAKLNEDWYFKHYWLMRNVDELKGIRAAMFDLELQDGKWIERREFLTARNYSRKTSGIPIDVTERMRSMIPDDVSFFKLRSLADDTGMAVTIVRDTLLDGVPSGPKQSGNLWSWESYDDYSFYAPAEDGDSSYDRYSDLSSEYDATIDNPQDARIKEKDEPGASPLRNEIENQAMAALQQAIGPAHPLAAAVGTSPQTMPGPLFTEFRRVAIITLQSPANLKREALENAISKAVLGRLTVSGPSAELKWASHTEEGQSWRGLELPMLQWNLCYGLRDGEVIFSNSPELLRAVLTVRGKQSTSISEIRSIPSLDDLTIIRFDQRKQTFDDIVGKLDAESIKAHQQARNPSNSGSNEPPQEFFSGSISSLLDVASRVGRIEIKRSSFSNHLQEEIDFILK